MIPRSLEARMADFMMLVHQFTCDWFSEATRSRIVDERVRQEDKLGARHELLAACGERI
jgi:hypothetical protein